MTDILKKPVHTALLPLTHIQSLQAQGKLPKNAVSLEAPSPVNLPKQEEANNSPRLRLPKSGANQVLKKDKIRTRLRIMHNKIPPLSKDKEPPCETCTGAPCCKAFLVQLTEDEYESGLYANYAVKITEESREQLRFNIGAFILSLDALPILYGSYNTVYYLEGAADYACPFLGENNKCTIYNDRPTVCRSYSCVGDSRITEEMRKGK